MRRNRAAANRYARALLEVTLKQADPRAVEQQLADFVGLFKVSPILQKLLLNPALPPARKQAVVAQLSTRVGLAPVLARLVGMLTERDALALLPDLLEAYRRRMREHLGIAEAEVRTAVPLTAAQQEALRRRLAEVTGKQVEMTTAVDPTLIGGAVARIESTIYDGSVRRQLARLQEHITEGM